MAKHDDGVLTIDELTTYLMIAMSTPYKLAQEGQKTYSKTKPIRIEEFGDKRKRWPKCKASDIDWKVTAAQLREREYDLDIKNCDRQDEEIQHTSVELLDLLEASFARSSDLVRKHREEY